MKSEYVFTKQIQKNVQKLLQYIENHLGEMWQNMVSPAKYGSLLYPGSTYFPMPGF